MSHHYPSQFYRPAGTYVTRKVVECKDGWSSPAICSLYGSFKTRMLLLKFLWNWPRVSSLGVTHELISHTGQKGNPVSPQLTVWERRSHYLGPGCYVFAGVVALENVWTVSYKTLRKCKQLDKEQMIKCWWCFWMCVFKDSLLLWVYNSTINGQILVKKHSLCRL